MPRRTIRVATWVYRTADGKPRRAYFGNTVDLTDAEVARAERAGVFAAEELDAAPAAPEPAPAPAEVAPAPEVAPASAEVEADAPVVPKPSRNDTKAEWIEYAVSRGADREIAEDVTKADLIAEYGDD